MLLLQICFENVTTDGINTINLVPEWETEVDNLPSSMTNKALIHR